MHQGSPRTVGYLHTLLAYAEWMGFNSFYEEDLGSVGLRHPRHPCHGR